METKATQGNRAGDLNTMSDGTTQQMSETWINDRIADSGLSGDDADDLRAGFERGEITFVKADVTGVRTDAPEGPDNGLVTFTELKQSREDKVTTNGT